MIFQSFIAPMDPMVHSILKNHQLWQKFGKKFKKSLVQLALNPFLHSTHTPPNFRVCARRKETEKATLVFRIYKIRLLKRFA